MLQVNITALIQLTGLFLPGMVQRRRGGILNVASVAGFLPGPGMAVYYATKACVLSFTEALAVELAGTHVTVTALCPGPTATNLGKMANTGKDPDDSNGQNDCGIGRTTGSSGLSQKNEWWLLPGFKTASWRCFPDVCPVFWSENWQAKSMEFEGYAGKIGRELAY